MSGDVPVTRCPRCHAEVAVGAFCGRCGAQLSTGRGTLRPGAYVAAPGEHMLRLAVASSLFPHLPHRSRGPFRAALALLFLALVAFALLRWQAPLIAVGALGFPLLFLLYLHESDIDDDLPASSLALTAALGLGFGVGWTLLTGSVIADSYDVALSDGSSWGRSLVTGLGTPAGAAILMVLPALVVRLSRPATREALDGFVIGALGAVVYTAAATLTRLAPQFGMGVRGPEIPVGELLAEAGIQGVALPLTTAAVGGLVGVALWFPRPTATTHRPALIPVVSSVVFVLALAAAVGLMEVTPLMQGLHLGLYLLITVIALLALRIAIQAALLREAPDVTRRDGRVLCPHCEHVVPDEAFCPNCGVAAHAASRTSRAVRRNVTAAAETVTRPGYALPPGSYAAVPARHTGATKLLTELGAGTAVAVAVAITVSVLATPVVPRYVCPPDCGTPPIGKPVATNPWFTSSDGKFAVQYPRAGTAYQVTLDDDSVKVDFTAGDTGTMEFFGLPAGDRTPQQIADDLIDRYYPDATTDYEIPNAMVGYQPGYGVVKDEYPQDGSGTFTRLRLLVMVAIKNDYALVAAAVGPYHQFTPDFGSGHPSGANLQLALDMGKYVNSFMWRDGPPR